MNKIKLNSRYGDENYLKHLKDDTYILESEFSYRYGQTNDGRNFVDPSGGPFIAEGTILEENNRKVKKVEYIKGTGCTITFE